MARSDGRSGSLLLAVGTALVVPIVGAVLLNFYLSGPTEEELALAASFSPKSEVPGDVRIRSPIVTEPAIVPTPSVTPSPTPEATNAATVTVTPVPTESPIPESNATPEPTETIPPPREVSPGTTVTVNADDGLNVRVEPSTDSEVTRVLRFNQEVVLTGGSVIDGEIQWVELEEPGWVQARYLTFAE